MNRSLILSALFAGVVAVVAAPSASLAREKGEAPRREDRPKQKVKQRADDKGGQRKGGKHRDDGPKHR